MLLFCMSIIVFCNLTFNSDFVDVEIRIALVCKKYADLRSGKLNLVLNPEYSYF